MIIGCIIGCNITCKQSFTDKCSRITSVLYCIFTLIGDILFILCIEGMMVVLRMKDPNCIFYLFLAFLQELYDWWRLFIIETEENEYINCCYYSELFCKNDSDFVRDCTSYNNFYYQYVVWYSKRIREDYYISIVVYIFIAIFVIQV